MFMCKLVSKFLKSGFYPWVPSYGFSQKLIICLLSITPRLTEHVQPQLVWEKLCVLVLSDCVSQNSLWFGALVSTWISRLSFCGKHAAQKSTNGMGIFGLEEFTSFFSLCYHLESYSLTFFSTLEEVRTMIIFFKYQGVKRRFLYMLVKGS